MSDNTVRGARCCSAAYCGYPEPATRAWVCLPPVPPAAGSWGFLRRCRGTAFRVMCCTPHAVRRLRTETHACSGGLCADVGAERRSAVCAARRTPCGGYEEKRTPNGSSAVPSAGRVTRVPFGSRPEEIHRRSLSALNPDEQRISDSALPIQYIGTTRRGSGRLSALAARPELCYNTCYVLLTP